MLGFFRKKSRDFTQPHKEWPWSLTVNGMPSGEFVWKNVLRELSKLTPDPDHFLILNQQNPREPGEYWFLQAARSSVGEQAGWYIVECGFSSPVGPYCSTWTPPIWRPPPRCSSARFRTGSWK